jgi:hypothetical protein
MGNLNGGFNSNEHKSNLFPEGRFRFLINESNLVDAKKEGVVIGKDWEFKLICISEPHMNRPLTRRYAYARDNMTANVKQQVDIGKAQVADICRAVGVLSPNDTSDLNEKQFEADVKIKGDFNNLAKIKACGSQPAATPASTGSAQKPGGW